MKHKKTTGHWGQYGVKDTDLGQSSKRSLLGVAQILTMTKATEMLKKNWLHQCFYVMWKNKNIWTF